ncbi:hypothetical protein SCB71_18055 [Herbiconiux sp. KACC 21604]|uniref:dihydroorotate dehydrogenase n=1 Tax=unclassified Herbiconiux TaxID=2618217 RepID=UPI001492B49A|nr:dihydroorotate dehydrogenase [Herbiconiux sp. SALV-R1]QJU54973.1 dihydroorotate dehydrogenase [Herbiconiux sp. SALV-R1]WPO86099.1 hypothetical protein SCB71_18055 [Herbiconiux sp. KACC 21604]
MTSLRSSVAGFETANPVWVGSSELTMDLAGITACVDAGAGAVVAKSVNEVQAARDQLDIADYAYLDDRLAPVDPVRSRFLFNRSGLAQSTLDDWVRMLAEAEQYARARDSAVVGSITVASAEGAAAIADRLWSVVEAVELNVGAPHGREAASGAVRQLTDGDAVAETVRAVRRVSDKPLIVKLPGTASDVVGLARSAVSAGADAVTLIGRFNGFVPDIDSYDPVLGSWGAIGGPWCLPLSLFAVSKAYRDPAVGVPLIGTNGARDADDVVRFLLSGACAVEVVDAVWVHGPAAITRLVAGVREHLERHGHTDVAEIVGASAERARAYGEIAPTGSRPEPWKR